MTVLIIARHGGEPEYAGADIYRALTREEAERFCDLWNDNEVEHVKSVGGYPGVATIVEDGDIESAGDWMALREQEMAA